MAILIDPLANYFDTRPQVYNNPLTWFAHLSVTADSPIEHLHEFALLLDIPKHWFCSTAKVPYYLVTPERHELSVECGVEEMTHIELVKRCSRKGVAGG